MKIKSCYRCEKEFPANKTYFHSEKRNKDGLSGVCKVCKGYSFPIHHKAKEGHKICTKCEKEYPSHEAYFHLNRKSSDGFHPNCKRCRGYEFGEILPTNHKRCNMCENLMKLSEFNRQAWTSDGYSNRCRRCDNKQRRKDYKVNPNIRNYHLRYYKENKSKYLEWQREWRRRNRGRVLYQVQKRLSRKKGLHINYSDDLWEEAIKHFEGRCCYCGIKSNDLTQDHFIPISKGGEYTKQNIIPCCKSCNSSKGNKDFDEWYPMQEFYSKENENKILRYLGYKNGVQQLTLI